MYYGLETNDFISSGDTLFDLDFSYNKIILNIYPDKCELDINCEETDEEPETGFYKNKSFTYYSASTFLSWETVIQKVVKSRDQYNSLRTFKVLNSNFDGISRGSHII